MTDSTREFGHQVEQRVARLAQDKGWQVLSRNFSCRYGEIDLVCCYEDVLVVIEVRYRDSQEYGGAIASVSKSKQKKIIRTTQYFLLTHPQFQHLAVRFDVVGVNKQEIEWLEGAFYAGY